MELRNGSLVGGSPGDLPPHLRATFEQGVRTVLQRWTALCLAVENEWGGRDSKDKAERLFADILSFFYDHKEHYADDLEVDLEEIMLSDFNTQAEDDSPREVSKELVALHNELLRGESATLTRLRGSSTAAAAGSLRADEQPGTTSGSEASSDESESEGEAGDDAADMEVDDDNPATTHKSGRSQPQGPPLIDEDGFQLVQSKSRGRANARRS